MKHLWILMLCLAQPLAAQTLSVVHEKSFWRDGRGTIEISPGGIAYHAENKEDSRSWKYDDIQYFDRLSDREFTILTYQDQKLLLGRDRKYRFRITHGALTDSLFQLISGRMGRPVTDRVVRTVTGVEYSLPVKHLHTLGGCEGTLEFTSDAIYYVSQDRKDARAWKLDRDIQMVSSTDRYRLEIQAYDNNRRAFSRTRIYRFELKKPLDAEFYRNLKLKLYRLESVHLPLK